MTGPVYRAIIVDDERMARMGLRAMLAAHPEVEVVGEASSGVQAAVAIETQRPDLVFLDIQMPDRDGFQLLAGLIPSQRPAVVFVTAHGQHALHAFGMNAVDYLLKPFSRDRLAAAIRRVVRFLRGAAVESAGVPRERRLIARDGQHLVFVDPADVRWFEVYGNYLRLALDGRHLLLRETLGAIAARLDAGTFVRINRSVIVNLRYVEKVRRNPAGQFEFRMPGGIAFRASRRYGRDVRAAVLGH
ncbi:MAG TPA: LytTR family DNA-binding domain-containing protein [Gemmatimonadaceae bacterium]|jgi:two-component system LytT family response regulator|nr:LytTR family DNA-binding domain-containing protein [Gemmatimonadaceae bacterium]